jgi:hypothetical protein
VTPAAEDLQASDTPAPSPAAPAASPAASTASGAVPQQAALQVIR